MRPANSMYIPPTVEYQDKRYTINRLIREIPEENPDYWKSFIPHDIVLRKDGFLWFLQEITEVFPIDINYGKEKETTNT